MKNLFYSATILLSFVFTQVWASEPVLDIEAPVTSMAEPAQGGASLEKFLSDKRIVMEEVAVEPGQSQRSCRGCHGCSGGCCGCGCCESFLAIARPISEALSSIGEALGDIDFSGIGGSD